MLGSLKFQPLKRGVSLPLRTLGKRFKSDEPEQNAKNDDITYVDINNPEKSPEDAAATNHFFEYQTGRWLKNDRAERAKRFVKFDFKGLAQLLQNELNVTQNGAEIETLEPLFEGKHNKLYKIVLKDQRSYVLRIPYQIGLEEYRTARLQSEAATLSYLSEHVFDSSDKFRATTPISYSATTNNPLKTPYMLLSYVNGNKLAAEWKPWVTDIDEKKPVIESVAELSGRILKEKFPAYGSLFFADDAPEGYETVKVNDKYVIGPSMEKRFWRSEVSKPFRGPFKTWQEYLEATGKVQITYAEVSGKQPSVLTAQRYLAIATKMFDEAQLSGEIASPRLCDPDLSPLNIISQDNGEKLWLFDVENTSIKPYMLHGIPWFVRNPGERVYQESDVQNYDEMSDEQKGIVKHMIALTQNEYVYERALKEQVPELILAHHPNLKRKEEVVHRAMNTDIDTGFHNDLNYSMLRLLQLWNVVSPDTPVPVELSEQEIQQLVTEMMEWNNELVRNRFLESKHYVPADVFDQLLGTGLLKVVDEKVGNYELSEEFLKSQQPF